MSLLDQLVSSDVLTIRRSPDFDHFRGIERLGEANSIPTDCRGFASAFAAVTLKSCSIYLQRTFPRILQTRYCTTGAMVGIVMSDCGTVTLNGVEGRAPDILLVKGKAVCEIVEPRANLVAFVNFVSIDDRGWPGERDRGQFVTTEPARYEALRAVIREVLLLASNAPDAILQPGMRENIEESIMQAVDQALQAVPQPFDGKRPDLTGYLSLVRKFDEFLAANAGRTLYSADMAKQLGVSVRTLHNAVFAIRGMSMHHYTRLRRLWSVRQQLVQGGRPVSIKSIALVNGFWHLGEFLSLYRELFGETPQQTIAAGPRQYGA